MPQPQVTKGLLIKCLSKVFQASFVHVSPKHTFGRQEAQQTWQCMLGDGWGLLLSELVASHNPVSACTQGCSAMCLHLRLCMLRDSRVRGTCCTMLAQQGTHICQCFHCLAFILQFLCQMWPIKKELLHDYHAFVVGIVLRVGANLKVEELLLTIRL